MQPTDIQIGYLIKRVQNDLRTTMQRRMAGSGLTMSRYAALVALDEHNELSNADLARRCFVSPQTMTRLIRDIENAGLVRRFVNPASDRETLAALTDAGRDLLQAGHAISQTVQADLLDTFSDDDERTLRDLLQRAATNLSGASRAIGATDH